MNQTWENDQKTNFGPGFGPFWSRVGPKFFFHGFYFYKVLCIVASYHCMQFEGKLMNQTWKNGNDVLPNFAFTTSQTMRDYYL